jgi:hypothetical protein
MKYLFLFLINLVALSISVMALLSTCAWGCPNTGTQLTLKISSGFLVTSQILIVVLWLTSKSRIGGRTGGE